MMLVLLGLFLSMLQGFAENAPTEYFLRPVYYYCELSEYYCSGVRGKLQRVNFDNWPDRSLGRERRLRINFTRDTNLTESPIEYSMAPTSADFYINSDSLYIDPTWSVAKIQKRVNFVVKAHALIQTTQFKRITCMLGIDKCLEAMDSMDMYRVNGILNRAHYQNLKLDNGIQAISRSNDPAIRNNTLHIDASNRNEIFTQLSLANKMAAVMEQLDVEQISCIGVDSRECSSTLEKLMLLPSQIDFGVDGFQEVIITYLGHYNMLLANPYMRQFIFSPHMSLEEIISLIVP